jgi:hypothetical protein
MCRRTGSTHVAKKMRGGLPSLDVLLRRLRMNSRGSLTSEEILESAALAASGQGLTPVEVLYFWVRSKQPVSRAGNDT